MRGYDERFGIYAIDLDDPNRERIPKNSALYLKEVAVSRNVTADRDEIFNVQMFPAPA